MPCVCGSVYVIFFFNDTATPEIYTLSLHDALPISQHPRVEAPYQCRSRFGEPRTQGRSGRAARKLAQPCQARGPDRKSTRLNSSHITISYAVFCLKKKKKINRSRRKHTTQNKSRKH